VNDHVEEIMRRASLLATARCRRMAANSRNGGRAAIEQEEVLVAKRTAELRTYVENLLCPKSLTEQSSRSTS